MVQGNAVSCTRPRRIASIVVCIVARATSRAFASQRGFCVIVGLVESSVRKNDCMKRLTKVSTRNLVVKTPMHRHCSAVSICITVMMAMTVSARRYEDLTSGLHSVILVLGCSDAKTSAG